MSPAVMTQMNTRIERDLKQRGDAALARAGFSPSEAVRALWTFAAAHESEPHVVAQALAIEDPHAEERQQHVQKRLASLNRIQQRMDEFNERFGITPEAIAHVNQMSDEALLEQALRERYEERGLA